MRQNAEGEGKNGWEKKNGLVMWDAVLRSVAMMPRLGGSRGKRVFISIWQ